MLGTYGAGPGISTAKAKTGTTSPPRPLKSLSRRPPRSPTLRRLSVPRPGRLRRRRRRRRRALRRNPHPAAVAAAVVARLLLPLLGVPPSPALRLPRPPLHLSNRTPPLFPLPSPAPLDRWRAPSEDSPSSSSLARNRPEANLHFLISSCCSYILVVCLLTVSVLTFLDSRVLSIPCCTHAQHSV